MTPEKTEPGQPDLLASRIRGAREDLGLTQQQVADWLGVRRPAVAEMEAGTRAAKSEELVRLSLLYGRSVAWLAGSPPSPEDRLSAVLFRTGETTDASLRREAHQLGRRCALLREAEHGLGLADDPTPPQYPDERALADFSAAVDHGRRVAYQERHRLSLGVHAPLSDAWGIVEAAGLRVFPIQLGNQHPVDGIFAVFDEKRACVGVNVDKWVFRQIFTVVHEYAHALMDRSAGSEVCHTGNAWAPSRNVRANRELRANQFAAVFLIPREALISHLDAIGKLRASRHAAVAVDLTPIDIVRAQDHFGSSAEMLLWRMQNEGLIHSRERGRLLADTRERGVNALARSLGYDWRSRAQPITRAQEVALHAYTKGHLSIGQLSELFAMNKSDMLQKLGEWRVVQEFADSDALVGAVGAA